VLTHPLDGKKTILSRLRQQYSQAGVKLSLLAMERPAELSGKAGAVHLLAATARVPDQPQYLKLCLRDASEDSMTGNTSPGAGGNSDRFLLHAA
jgi:hypothetical protein